jgi:cellulose synthase (UDP-forming)
MASEQKGSFLGRLVMFILALLAMAAATLVVIVPLRMEEQAVFGLGVFVLAWILKHFSSRLITMFLIVVSLTVSSRYLFWRFTSTMDLESSIEFVLGIMLVCAEIYAFVVLWFGYFQALWPLERKPIPVPGTPDTWPTIDVLIPTYNEPLEVVRPTVLAARAMDWPKDKFNVIILDDGKRDEFRIFAEEANVGYITRDNNQHAKAGNINEALKQLSGEHVAIFDCDHVPTRSFLQFNMGWMVADPLMALVQTPHHFHSPDPFERNLKTFRTVPNEGELFYNLVQPGNDLWNSAFFCGSCAIIRRTALDEVGGIAVETVTEDAHTALRLHRKGWNSCFLRTVQASGLATESLSAHIGQRIRWARGMVQIFRIDCPLFGRGLKWYQRLSYSSAMVHFLNGLPRLIFLNAPLIFLFFNINIFNKAALVVLTYALPHLAHATLTSSRIHGRFRHSFWAEVYETVLCTYILVPTLLALINPKLGSFNVTAKGGLVQEDYFDRKIARPYIIMLLLNLFGIGLGLWRLGLDRVPFDSVMINVAWAIYNIVVLGAAIAVAFELKQRRAVTRIDVRVPAMMRLASGHTISSETLDLSRGGAMLSVGGTRNMAPDDDVMLSLYIGSSEVSVPAKVVAVGDDKVRLRFEDLTLQQESGLTRAIFSRADAWTDWSETVISDHPVRAWVMILVRAVQGIPKIITGRSRSET